MTVDQIKGDSLRSYALQSVTKIPIRNELCEMAVTEDHYKIDTHSTTNGGGGGGSGGEEVEFG